MPQYNGHRSWNAWNVSLWINNDLGLYLYARTLVSKYGRQKAAQILAREFKGDKTPDGGKYNLTTIYEALEGMDEK